eukprot:Skav215920  [mRNA]  locus=scaffold226:186014:196681:+ [translate_table: standard]
MPSGATLTNCYKLRKGDRDGEQQWAVPQSFSFIAREGLPGEGRDLVLDDRVPKRLRGQGGNKDVFALVKATMSDDHLVQPPILVFPQAFLPATEGFFNRINSTNLLLSASLDEGRVEELLHLAENMDVDFPHLKRGVQHVTAEKLAPSPIDYLGALKQAVMIEKRLARQGTSKALRDVLSRSEVEQAKRRTKLVGQLEDSETTDGRRVLCGSVVLDKPADDLMQRVANRIYEDARGGHLTLTGFPDYQPVVQALRNTEPTDSGKEYQVTLKRHDRLLILKTLAEKWLDSEYKDEATIAIEEHNKKFNPDAEFWKDAETPDAPAAKRIRLDAEEVVKEEEATEVMEDSCGRWFSFCAEPRTVMILEKKPLPDHLAGLPCVESPSYLSTIIRELEDAGEVKLGLMHHTIQSTADKLECTSTKPLTFLLDPPKSEEGEDGKAPPKKKQRKSSTGKTLTAKSFGSVLEVAKVKKAKRLLIGWRMRHPCDGFHLVNFVINWCWSSKNSRLTFEGS